MKSIKLGQEVCLDGHTVVLSELSKKAWLLTVSYRGTKETAIIPISICREHGIILTVKRMSAIERKNKRFALAARLQQLAVTLATITQ